MPHWAAGMLMPYPLMCCASSILFCLGLLLQGDGRRAHCRRHRRCDDFAGDGLAELAGEHLEAGQRPRHNSPELAQQALLE